MNFIKYQHIEKFGTPEVEGLEFGLCYVFPKLDGTNASLWYNDGIHAGSRNRHLTLDDDNAGFYKWALQQENLKEFFKKYPNIRLFGEWLVPHTLKTYRNSAWKKFYVFDVVILENDEFRYLNYDTYKILLDEYNIDYIPPICRIVNPSYEKLVEVLDKNIFLIEDGKGCGEGIVVKNYEYKNKYGRIVWAKIVRNDFKDEFAKNKDIVIKAKSLIEDEIVNKYVTQSLVEKEYAKICNEVEWSSKMIPRLLETIFYCLVKEESWNFVKEHKNPSINFSTLKHLTIVKIKQLMSHLF